MPQQPGRDASGYFAEDTIAALSSGLGGAISMVRVSGPCAWECVAGLSDLNLGASTEPRRVYRAHLYASSAKAENQKKKIVLDDAVVIPFRSPQSFTGEDVVELHLHGSPYIAGEVLKSLFVLGCRQALPGEFSFRAVRNGKMDVVQAQGVADLIGSKSGAAASLALEKMDGVQSSRVRALKEGLVKTAMMGEVGIDFSDQDVEELNLDRLKADLAPFRVEIDRLAASFERGSRIQKGLGLALVGLPNAGKSSFFNALLGEDRSIVTEIEGTTRDVVGEDLVLKTSTGLSVSFRLEDTAGIRKTLDQVEKMGVDRSQRAVERADLVLIVCDPGQPVKDLGRLLSDVKTSVGSSPQVAVLTKSLESSAPAVKSAVSFLKGCGVGIMGQVDSPTGEGLSEVVAAIAARGAQLIDREHQELLLTREDHRDAAVLARDHLDRALLAQEYELFAADIRHCLHALEPLWGEVHADDILSKIFSEFCIGK